MARASARDENYQNGSERGLSSQRSHCHDKANLGVVDRSLAVRASGEKDECQVRLTGIEWKCWMGTEIGKLGGYGFRGIVTAGDRSNQKEEKMGAGYVNLRRKNKK